MASLPADGTAVPLLVRRTTWRGMAAWLIRTATHPLLSTGERDIPPMEAIVTEVGGHIACLREVDSDLNPLWVPLWHASHPEHSSSVGTTEQPTGSPSYYGGSEAPLLAALTGYSLCIDRFGASRAQDQPHRPVPHGEASIVPWSTVQLPAQDVIREEPSTAEVPSASPSSCTATFECYLPLAKLKIRRQLSFLCRLRNPGEGLSPSIPFYCLRVATSIYSDVPRSDVEWCEHISVGQPFIDFASTTSSVPFFYNWPGEPLEPPSSRFNDLPPLAVVASGTALHIPTPTDPPCGDVVSGPAIGSLSAANVSVPAGGGGGGGGKRAWWEIHSPHLRRTLRCDWDPREKPWLTLWTQHRSRTGAPWCGRERVRGMELSTKPFPDGETTPLADMQRISQHSIGAESTPLPPATIQIPAGEWVTHTLTLSLFRTA
jgi:hypothetical protein